MEKLKIEWNKEGKIIMDKENGVFEFSGRILPHNPKEFFEPLFNWFDEYIKNPNSSTVITFKMDYFNTASSKKILDALLVLETIFKMDNFYVEVHWYYQEEDQDLYEAGVGYSELVNIPFKFKNY